MFVIDQYAYSNRLRSVHPGEKFAFAVSTMAICLALPSVAASLAVVLLMAGAAVLRAGIPGRVYLKLMTLPLSFLLVGVAAVAVSVTSEPGAAVHGVTVRGLTVGVTARDLGVAAGLFCRSLGAVSCLYFLSLTTPMVEIIPVLRGLKVPALFIELMGLVYRFIFVVMDTAAKMYTAQSSRWGYASLKTSFHSLGQLVSNLFIKSHHRSQALYTALMSRCYNGDLNVVGQRYAVSKGNIAAIAVIDLALVALALATGGHPLKQL
ncbi:MAG: cobalt ECF transporter T component CbiQ [Peptococcaceae bacterium]|nr:cobalt ECF transporter T component CbiQ [Peptococcaceae bacterium]